MTKRTREYLRWWAAWLIATPFWHLYRFGNWAEEHHRSIMRWGETDRSRREDHQG